MLSKQFLDLAGILVRLHVVAVTVHHGVTVAVEVAVDDAVAVVVDAVAVDLGGTGAQRRIGVIAIALARTEAVTVAVGLVVVDRAVAIVVDGVVADLVGVGMDGRIGRRCSRPGSSLKPSPSSSVDIDGPVDVIAPPVAVAPPSAPEPPAELDVDVVKGSSVAPQAETRM